MTSPIRIRVAIQDMGESTGLLPSTLEQISTLYREVTRRSTRIAIGTLEPLLICLMGATVGFIVFGFFAVIMNLSTIV